MKDPDVTDKFVCCPEIIINSEQMSDADVLGKFILFIFFFFFFGHAEFKINSN